MQSTNEFPLENNGDYTTRIRFLTNDRGGRFAEIRQPDHPDVKESIIILTSAQFQEATRLACGTLFPINAVDHTMLIRHLSEQVLSAVSANRNKLLKIAAGVEKIPTGKEDAWMHCMVRSCISIALLSLRAIEVTQIPPVQGDDS